MVVTVSVDARTALARFSPAGIPLAVRTNLRRVLPDLTKRLGNLIETKLNTGLKTRRRLVVKKELVENASAVYGRVRTMSISEPFLLPIYLEEGTKPHIIRGKNRLDKLLFFEWEGSLISKHMVNHPGFKGIHYSRGAFAEMEGEIRRALDVAVKEGARSA